MELEERPKPVGRRRASKPTVLVAIIVVLAFFAAACSSDKSTTSTGTTSAGSSAGLDEAKATVAKYSTPPTTIAQTEALTSKPPPKTVAFVVCADPSCTVLADAMKAPIEALGWTLTTVNASATDPGSAIQQAIDAGVDYIAETGANAAQFKPQMENAKAAGIPIFECYATDVPAGKENNIYSDCFDASAAVVYSKALMDWMITDSSGSGNAVAVSLPAFPILSAQVDAAKAEVESSCPNCKLSSLDLTVDDLSGGKVPQAIVSYLQSNPDTDYVYLTFNGLWTGVPEAIKAAGLSDKVKIIGTQASQAELQGIIDGEAAAWTALPQEFSVWSLVDQMAHLAVDQWSVENERKTAIAPFYLVTTAEQAQELVGLENGWAGPEGYQDQFKKLWGV